MLAHRRWIKGIFETFFGFVCGFRILPYFRECASTDEGEEYSCWWLKVSPRRRFARRCWVLIPGGMSSGNDSYLTSLVKSDAMSDDEDCVVFHNPGQGGSTARLTARGLSRIDCLTHFLQKIRGDYEKIVVFGFSAGGMPVVKMASQHDPIADAFVTCCTPDKIRLVFEEQSRRWFRLDAVFTLWFHVVCRMGGLHALVPFKPLPWPPTWMGYMKPFTEKTFETASGRHRTFEELESEHFDGSPVRHPSAPCLRIWCVNDPIINPDVLERDRWSLCEVWWEKRGGHCCQFYWSSDIACRLRRWVRDKSPLTEESCDS